jgi:hypothetical protein
MDGACTLVEALGRIEPCRGPLCAFWLIEKGEERCVLRGVEQEVLTRAPLARYLLALRRDLDEAARLAETISTDETTRGH